MIQLFAIVSQPVSIMFDTMAVSEQDWSNGAQEFDLHLKIIKTLTVETRLPQNALRPFRTSRIHMEKR